MDCVAPRHTHAKGAGGGGVSVQNAVQIGHTPLVRRFHVPGRHPGALKSPDCCATRSHPPPRAGTEVANRQPAPGLVALTAATNWTPPRRADAGSTRVVAPGRGGPTRTAGERSVASRG